MLGKISGLVMTVTVLCLAAGTAAQASPASYSIGAVAPSGTSIGTSTDTSELAFQGGGYEGLILRWWQNQVPPASYICDSVSSGSSDVTTCDSPRGGIYLTSFSIRAGATGGDVRLFTYRPGSGGSGASTDDTTGTVVSRSATETAVADQTNTFSTNIAVNAGDGVGISAIGVAPELSYADTYYEPAVCPIEDYDYATYDAAATTSATADYYSCEGGEAEGGEAISGWYQMGSLSTPPAEGDAVTFSSLTADRSPNLAFTVAVDIDGDGLVGSGDSDNDGDSIDDSSDNCAYKANVDQSDLNHDGEGTVCDRQERDYDGDGKRDFEDNCVYRSNSDQADSDGDGKGDACDSRDNRTTTSSTTSTSSNPSSSSATSSSRITLRIKGKDRKLRVTNKTKLVRFYVRADRVPTTFYVQSVKPRVKTRGYKSEMNLFSCKSQAVTTANNYRPISSCKLTKTGRTLIRKLKRGQALRLSVKLRGHYKSTTGATASDNEELFLTLIKR